MVMVELRMSNRWVQILLALAALGIFIFLTASGVIVYYSMNIPKIDSLSDYRPQIPSKILASDGTELAEIGRRRYVTTVDEIPQTIIDAFLSAEDDNFYKHDGVDYMGMVRAFFANIKAGKIAQGGSTITQQVAKSLLLSNERSIARKIKDILLALKIEKKLTKKEILYLYLNQVYLGSSYYGVKAAFQGYFNKDFTKATIAESAMVAGLLVAPSRYSPYNNPKFAKMRQAYVLKRMLENNKIGQAQYDEALQEQIKYKLTDDTSFKAPYFTEWVRLRLVELVGEEKFLTDGFIVKTTLDLALQKEAEKVVWEGAKEIDKRQGYKGPIGKIELDSQLLEHEKNFRKELMKEKSSYFVINSENERQYEFDYNETEYSAIKEEQKLLNEKFNNNQFVPGYVATDPLLALLEEGKIYKAVVLKVDNWSRIIYVSLGGVHGIIPYEEFRWAHEREITETRQFYPYVTKPTTIVKPGDIVQVSLLGKSTTIWDKANAPFKQSLQKKDYAQELKIQKFIHCLLDQEPEVQGALVAISPHTGKILSFVGGTDFTKSKFNRVIQSLRQPGSSFKALLYAAALENGFNPSSILNDSPMALAGVDDSLSWKPKNYDGLYMGEMTLRNAFEMSRNVPAIDLAERIGINKIRIFTQRLGLQLDLPQDLSIALGSFGISLFDLTSTYAIFPNGGKLIDPISLESIVDRDGNKYEINEALKKKRIDELRKVAKEEGKSEMVSPETILTNNKSGEEKIQEEDNVFYKSLSDAQVYDERLAFIMTHLLRGVIQSGTAQMAASLSRFIGGKTGTTNNYVDALFVGFSPNIVTGVWTGFDGNETLGWSETGSKAALPIWVEFMKSYLRKNGEHDFKTPEGVMNVMVNKETGKPLNGNMTNGFNEIFVEGYTPMEEERKAQVSIEDLKNDNVKPELLEDDDYYNVQ